MFFLILNTNFGVFFFSFFLHFLDFLLREKLGDLFHVFWFVLIKETVISDIM